MPHQRDRQVMSLLLQKIDYSPVVIINGARQVGKSYLVRELLGAKKKKLLFLSLDSKELRSFAIANPSAFLNQKSAVEILAIDEAQRAPDLFEAVKEQVDLQRKPGQYILLGSTEFSHRTKIRESLTGRATRALIYPFNLGETKGEKLRKLFLKDGWLAAPRVSQRELLIYLDRGGMPGIFAIRNENERRHAWDDWLDLLLNRDIYQIKNFRPDPSLTKAILEFIAVNMENSVHDIAKALSTDRRKIQKHIDALKALFVIHAVEPTIESTGEAIYFLCDVGIAFALGARFEQRLRTWVLLELLSQLSYSGESLRKTVFTYRTEKGSRIEFVIKPVGHESAYTAIKVFPFEGLVYQDLEILRAFGKKFENAKALGLASRALAVPEANLRVFSWETLA